MQEEINAAVAWWSKQLGKRAVQTGDAMNDALAINVRSLAEAPTEEQERLFAQTLREHLTVRFQTGFHQSMCLKTDYEADEVLQKALDAAEIKAELPYKTVMWIDPGKVEVKTGYNAQWKVIYPADKP